MKIKAATMKFSDAPLRRRSGSLLLCGLILTAALTISGCSLPESITSHFGGGDTAEQSDSGYSIFYRDAEDGALNAEGYQLTATTETGIIEECLTALMTAPEKGDDLPLITEAADYIRYEYDRESRTLTLYFGPGYTSLDKTEEILLRSGIVRTMTQFTAIIDYVIFNINGQPLTDSDGRTLKMKHNDFVTDISLDMGDMATLETGLYFVSADGTALERVTYTQRYNTGVGSLAQVVLDALIRGPVSGDSLPVVSPDTVVRSIYIHDNICEVDFNSAFLETFEGRDFSLNVYGVVGSLTALDEINGVKITVNGEKVTEAPDGVDLTGILTYQGPEDETETAADADAADEAVTGEAPEAGSTASGEDDAAPTPADEITDITQAAPETGE